MISPYRLTIKYSSSTQTLELVESNLPTLTLNGADTIIIGQNATFTDPGATATDTEDCTLTSSISVTGTISAATLGTYTKTYTYTDTGGLFAIQ